MNHRFYLLPSVYFPGNVSESLQGTATCIRICRYVNTHSTACTNANSCIQMATCLHSKGQMHQHTHTYRSSVNCSITGGGVISLFSLSWCWHYSLCCLCGCHPPTHLCPSGPSGPESIWHLPLCLSSCHLRRPPPTALMCQHFSS